MQLTKLDYLWSRGYVISLKSLNYLNPYLSGYFSVNFSYYILFTYLHAFNAIIMYGTYIYTMQSLGVVPDGKFPASEKWNPRTCRHPEMKQSSLVIVGKQRDQMLE